MIKWPPPFKLCLFKVARFGLNVDGDTKEDDDEGVGETGVEYALRSPAV